MIKKKPINKTAEVVFSKDDLEKAHLHASNNEIEIVKSDKCACFFCRQVYSARKIQDWINDERGISAICPECGIDAVVGDASGISLEKPILKALNLAYYGKDYVKKNPDAAKVYCRRFADGKITHKEKNEELFITYLSLLASKGDQKSALALAEVYHYGDEFIKADLDKAVLLYQDPCLSADQTALCRLGCLYSRDALSEEDYRKSYECFSKAAALGSLEAVYRLSDSYSRGQGVKKDLVFAFQLLYSAYGEAYARFTVDHRDWYDYPDFAYRLAKCYQNGLGVEKDEEDAIRLFLLAELSYSLRSTFGDAHEEPFIWKDIEEQITKIAKAHQLKKQDPIFDADAFSASFEEGNNPAETKRLSFVGFDKQSGELDFDVTYTNPALIIDVASLYAGFVSGTIRWQFNEVADAKFSSHSDWQKLDGNNDDGWSFVHVGEDGSEDTIAELRFFSDSGDDKKKAKKTNIILPKGKGRA